MNTLIWIGIIFCITQSAIFSGLNLAFFSISKLRLEVESRKGNAQAIKVARLRKDANFLLATILWGNVGINVLLTLLSNSVLTGLIAFLFSTIVITILGEIVPQAYFSRHALPVASLLSPVLRMYQVLLFPVAKPTAWILDQWLGSEAVQYVHEEDIQEMLRIHIEEDDADIEKVEGYGAINFLKMDDQLLTELGEVLVQDSILQLDFQDGQPLFPSFTQFKTDVLLQQVHRSLQKWVVITDQNDLPQSVLDADGFLRAALLDDAPTDPLKFCHKPIIVKDETQTIGDALPGLKVDPEHTMDHVIDEDVILVWNQQRRIITGADIFGRLMHHIVRNTATA
jgi:hypothetical protein